MSRVATLVTTTSVVIVMTAGVSSADTSQGGPYGQAATVLTVQHDVQSALSAQYASYVMSVQRLSAYDTTLLSQQCNNSTGPSCIYTDRRPQSYVYPDMQSKLVENYAANHGLQARGSWNDGESALRYTQEASGFIYR